MTPDIELPVAIGFRFGSLNFVVVVYMHESGERCALFVKETAPGSNTHDPIPIPPFFHREENAQWLATVHRVVACFGATLSELHPAASNNVVTLRRSQ
jgi:hypothetical protein